MILALIIALPFMGALLPLLAERGGRTLCAASAGVAPLIGLVLLLGQRGTVFAGQTLTASYSWLPEIGINLSLRLDGLGFLFALLILGIGLLVILYARYYLSEQEPMGRFFAFLLLFMGSMLGVVLAENLLLMMLFWELTSLSSFLLIGFWGSRSDARKGARMALTVTGGGGLALLAGVLLLGHIAGSFELTEVLAAGELIRAHALYPLVLILILLGVFTKSAQFPFHFWLPHAMAAPTPVSAYLHSATMVKAGIYLLARLNPVLGGSVGWGTLLITFGAATAVLGAFLAFRQTDLKRLLAYTTVTVLGQLTMLIGTNTSYGLQAFVLYLVAHSLYKGALFMAVGAIDHATGTRELARLGGLIRFMPLTGAAVALAAFSNAGLPPFFGFIAKEFKYSGLIEMGHIGWAVTLVMILTNALLFAAAGLVFLQTFLGKRGDYPRTPHEVGLPMWLGPMLLAIGGFLLGAWNAWPETWLVNNAVQAVARGPVDVHLYLWGGITPALVASLLTVSLGVLFYVMRNRVRQTLDRANAAWNVSGDLLWDRLLKRVFHFAGLLAARFQHGSLRQHLVLLALAVGGLLAVGLLPALPQLLQGSYSPISPLGLAGCLLALAGGVAAAFLPGRLTLLAALGACGLGLALVFVSVNAPDVAMTQLMVETLSLIFLALVFRKMPTVPPSGARAPWKRRLHASVAILFGLSVTGALLLAVSLPLPGEIAQWYQANSLPGGHGHNVVNVILVDFRAFDTLGEILVVALSALAAASLLGTGRRFGGEHSGEDAFTSPLLRQGLRPLAWLMLAASLLLLWRGHNLPGGGFIGGLVAACGLILLVLTYGHGQIRRVLPLAPAQLIGIGLGCAAGAGILGLMTGSAFLTGLWTFPGGLPLGTPLLFDIGVFLTVFGSALHMIDKLTGVRH